MGSEEHSPISEEEGEDIMVDMDRDYKKIPELDVYEEDGLDE